MRKYEDQKLKRFKDNKPKSYAIVEIRQKS